MTGPSPSPPPTPPPRELLGVLPWDIGVLPAEDLGTAFRDLARFVTWLRSAGLDVPVCWYVHPWVVERLTLLLHWRAIATAPHPAGPDRDHPKYVLDWWAAVRTLERDWHDLLGHDLFHKVPGDPGGREEAIAPLEDFVARLVAQRRGPVP
jgi:hypothetical protein